MHKSTPPHDFVRRHQSADLPMGHLVLTGLFVGLGTLFALTEVLLLVQL